MTVPPHPTVLFLLAAVLISCANLLPSSALDRFRLLLGVVATVWICRLIHALPLLEARTDNSTTESEVLYDSDLSRSPLHGSRAKTRSTKPPPVRLADYLRTHPQYAPFAPYQYTPSRRSWTCSSVTTSSPPVIIHVGPARYPSVAQKPGLICFLASISNLPAPVTPHVPTTLSPATPTEIVSLSPQVDAGAGLQKETSFIPQMHMAPTPRIMPLLPSAPNLPLRGSLVSLPPSASAFPPSAFTPTRSLGTLNPTASAPSNSYPIPRALPPPRHPTSLAKELLQRVTTQMDADAYYEELARMAAMRPSFGSAVCVPMEVD
ncbi:hypothetical protein B0H11DRAFT_2292355 [Mycena galericulata]|nr:hypothetical protein B0H11DRAFT_2292355 [Mycena galericulata]